MHKRFSVLVLIVCGFWGASRATAASICDGIPGNLVSNCGFETGDFTGWTLGGNTLNPGDNYYGVDAFDANSGNFGAYMSQDFFVGTSPVELSQTLATTVGATYDIAYWLEQDTAPTTGFTHAFSSTFGGTTLQSLAPTVALPGTVGIFTEYSFAETATAPSTTLQFAFENDDQFWSFDDVSVVAVAAATPEPSTGLPGGLALGALLLLLRHRRRGSVGIQPARL
jgi:MYXO-CTERM domain-containing protein